MPSTYRIEASDTALTIALRRRISAFTRSARSGQPRVPRAHQLGCAALAFSTDQPCPELIGAIRDAVREVGAEGTTLWTGSSGVDISAAMNDAEVTGTAMLLTTLAASPPCSGHLPGVPFS